MLTAIKCNRHARGVDSAEVTWESSARTMRWGDVRCAWVLLVLVAACERRGPRRDVPARAGSPVAPTAGSVMAPLVRAAASGCDAGWWPLAAGQRWRWQLERTWAEIGTGAVRHTAAVRDVSVRDAGAHHGAHRYVMAGWPRPWTEALTAELAVEFDRDGLVVRSGAVDAATLAPWFTLADDPVDDGRTGVDREVRPAQGDRPAELELVWRTLADDLTLRLACGLGPVEFAYHHHGTVEELRALRLDAGP